MDAHAVVIPAILDLSPMHLIIILVILLLLFGSRLPSIMRGLGGSVREFKKGMENPDQQTPPSYTATPPAAPPTGQAPIARTDQTPPAPPKP